MELSPAEVFGLFGRPEAGSWLFDARCESMVVGSAVRLSLPVGGHSGRRFDVELLGRLTAVRPNEMFVIEHVQPWRGRLKVTLDRLGARRTRVRVRADVSGAGVEWLVRHGGGALPVPPVRPDAVRIGVITSKSGPAAIYSMATEYLAELAVEEVNDSGGLDGRRLEILVADDETDHTVAAGEAQRLVRAGCRAIFACTTSISFAAISDSVRNAGVLLVHAVMNERGSDDEESVVRFGEQPATQIEAMAGRLMRATGGRGWFLVGEQYSWSYGAHRAARAAVPRAAGRVIAEAFTPLGTTDFAPLIERIQLSGADIVLSSLIGSDEVEFQRQCAAAGLRSSVSSLSLAMDEPTCEHIGATAAEGIWTALGYFQDGPAAGNPDLLSRYRAANGRWPRRSPRSRRRCTRRYSSTPRRCAAVPTTVLGCRAGRCSGTGPAAAARPSVPETW
ncbi:ABC transporter substrate-binding protein [Pseudonocardia broussonetiae]|uniref:ABC transporter substrate-binding protein n=1 Tax=Pseudonocardia broussonetiae TaxID=2736640 RepID=UPI001F03ACEE|nr:ABC transporter substrate-binding protein [Pseudonocardia broussonetiae]